MEKPKYSHRGAGDVCPIAQCASYAKLGSHQRPCKRKLILHKYSVLLRSKIAGARRSRSHPGHFVISVRTSEVVWALRGGSSQDYPMTPLFADTRTITHSIDCLLNGQDPYVVPNL